jgi:hypothetical protein
MGEILRIGNREILTTMTTTAKIADALQFGGDNVLSQSHFAVAELHLETTMSATKYYVGFEHFAGGDSLLPQTDRGFFSGYQVDVTEQEAADELSANSSRYDGEDESERLLMAAAAVGETKMRTMVETDHPEWLVGAINDLTPEAVVRDEFGICGCDDGDCQTCFPKNRK